jgi:DNA polymerase III sliding clamp (beta) subunit (PCNA family)
MYLPATLGPLARCAATDTGRYSMAGVQVSDPGDGTFRCVVTDGRSLLIARGICPERGHLNCPPDVGVIVPSAAWHELFRKTPKLIAPGRSWQTSSPPLPVTIESAGEKVRLETGERGFVSDRIDGHFPDWTQIIPKTPPAFTIVVNPELLANLLTAISHILGDETQRVTLCFWKPDAPMAVVAKDAAIGLCLDGLLMPLTDSSPPVRQPESAHEEEAEEEAQEEEDDDAA